MNEARFVAALQRKFPFRFGLGIGDDASAVRCGRDFQLISTDLLVEDVHFRLGDVTAAGLAEKALAVNISDIAAMGGRALYFYLGIAFPDGLAPGFMGAFFSGLARAAKKWRVELAGGDYSRAAKMVIAITVVGRGARPVRRCGAKPGDWIGITGPTGRSALGLKLLLAGHSRSPYIRCHQHPQPQVAKGLILAPLAHAMIDISDGLSVDLGHLCEESGVGAVLEEACIPVSPAAKRLSRRDHKSPLTHALADGEDYELLFALPAAQAARLEKSRLGRVIGEVAAMEGLYLRHRDGRMEERTAGGWEHRWGR